MQPKNTQKTRRKVEYSNKFSHVVTLGTNGSFDWPTQQERDIASGCRMLIINAINFYNLLYLSEELRQCKTATECDDLLKTILQRPLAVVNEQD